MAKRTVAKVASDAPPKKLMLNVPPSAPTGAFASTMTPNMAIRMVPTKFRFQIAMGRNAC